MQGKIIGIAVINSITYHTGGITIDIPNTRGGEIAFAISNSPNRIYTFQPTQNGSFKLTSYDVSANTSTGAIETTETADGTNIGPIIAIALDVYGIS